MSSATESASIDIKRYDRQIRLWGLETQTGLHGARILLLRATGLCNEIAKNLVLAGVGHVSIHDAGVVEQQDIDTGAVFYFSKADIGRGRAEVLAEGLRALNPSVDISVLTEELRDLGADGLKRFSYIIGTHGAGAIADLVACTDMLEAPTSDAPPPSKKARASGAEADPPLPRKNSNGADVVLPRRPAEAMPKLMAAGVLGMHGFCIIDLHTQEYQPPPKSAKAGEADVSASSSVDPPLTKRLSALYPSVQHAMAVDWSALAPRVPPFYCALQLLCDLQEHVKAPAGQATGTPEARLAWLEQRRQQKLAEAQRPEAWLSASSVAQVARHADAELAPVCAIVGGVVASEVIKIISGKGAPINNAFFFDALQTSEGSVQRLGPSYSCPWGNDAGKPRELGGIPMANLV